MECRLRDTAVHYETIGQGRPILMLHGWSVDHRYMMADFEPIFQLRHGWKRIYPDLPGHGRTRGPNWITSNEEMLQATLDFIDGVIPEQRFAVVGSSYGGYLARGVVYRKSALMDGMLLIGPLVMPGEQSPAAQLTLVKDEQLTSDLKSDFERNLFSVEFTVQTREALDYMRAYLLPAIEMADMKFLRERTKGKFSFHREGHTERLEKPVLILCGRQDSAVGYRDAWALLESFPRATFATLDRSAHVIPIDQKELFGALVNEWLDRLEEASGFPT